MTTTQERLPLYHLVDKLDTQELANDLGVSQRTIQRWITNGLNWQQADVFAVKVLGDLPELVWPEWGDIADRAVEQAILREERNARKEARVAA